jgi:uncharacterized protein (DUF1697 family)
MNTYIALLRGINVSGKNMMKMDALKRMFESKGLHEVQTYIQSGNVIFKSDENDTTKLSLMLAKDIHAEFGYDIPALVITRDYLVSIALSNPYILKENKVKDDLHLTLLNATASYELIDKMKVLAMADDEFVTAEKAIYIFCKNGYGRTKLTNSFFENKLKVSCTTRNWRTVERLVELSNY